MDWSSIAGTLAQFGLTGLGTIFGGPLGGTVGNALGNEVAKALGVEATPQAVQEAIEANPELAKARLADLESARQSDLEQRRIDAADTKDARETMTELVAAESPIAWGAVVFSGVFLFMASAIFTAVAAGKLPMDSMLNGAAISWVTLVANYWLGSSSGSKRMGDAVRAAALSGASPNAAQVAGQLAGQAISKAVKR